MFPLGTSQSCWKELRVISSLDIGEVILLLATCYLIGFLKHVLSQVWTSLMFYLWTFLSFQGSKVPYRVFGLLLSFPPFPASSWCLNEAWLHHEARPFVGTACPILIKMIMFCSANGAEQGPLFIFLQCRKEIQCHYCQFGKLSFKYGKTHCLVDASQD